MRVGQLSHHSIGWRVRKPSWGSCWLTVLDIGQRYIVGQLFDHQDKKVLGIELYNREDSDWELYVCAEEVIKRLPVRSGDER